MKPRVVVLLSGITLSAVLAAPIRPAAQEQRQQSDRAGNVGEGSTNPVPFVNQPMVPDAVAPGGPEFTLTVNGTGFVSGSVVNWNGGALATTFVSSSQLTATVPAADIATASTASVTVVSPSPGGGTSNVVFFTVTQASSTVEFSGPAYATGSAPLSLIAADFNGDGKLDLCTSNGNVSAVSILLGNGDGTFQPFVDYPTHVPPTGEPVAGDFNHDGKLDLALSNGFNANTVSILLGNGDGTFKAAVDYATPAVPLWLATGDFNGDGNLDLAVADFGEFNGATVSILLGKGDGTFQPHVEYATGSLPRSVAIGDFNRDGKLDLALPNQGDNTVSILLGNGDGTFQNHVDYPVAAAQAVTVGDFNEDGKLDLAVTNGSLNTVSVLLGNGDGTFQNYSGYAVGGTALYMKTADLNGDSHLDLAISSEITTNAVSVLLGNGDGTFQPYTDYAAGLGIAGVAIGDFNGDGRLDLAAANVFDNTVSVLLQTTTISLSKPTLNFPTQLVGTTGVPQQVTLTNTGPITLTISSIKASGDFLQTNTCGSSVPAGASCTINVSFKPTAKGTRTGTLTITDNAATSPQTVSLTGTGTVVRLSADTLNFGSQKVGTTSPPQTVTVTNAGSQALSIQGITLGGTDFSDFVETTTCPSSLPAKTSCVINVRFRPTATGAQRANLKISDDGGGSPQEVLLRGTGT